jgi:hypothetical protein
MNKRRQLAFVVRLWLEPTDAEDAHWRGVVQSLDDQRRRYFSDLSDAVEFLRAAMKLENPTPRP